MRPFSALMCTVLSVYACGSPPPEVPPTPKTPSASDLVEKSVALVASRDDGSQRAYCSGVWVSYDRVLTAAHCLSDVADGEFVGYLIATDLDREEATTVRLAAIVRRDEGHDLALLRALSPPSHRETALAPKLPPIGSPVQTMGHPLGQWYSYSTGEIAAVRYHDEDDTWMVQSTAPISPGNSGGGLFDTSGRLLGVCHAYYPRGQNMNLYIHLEHARAFLGVP